LAALGHLKRLLGSVIRVDVAPKTLEGSVGAPEERHCAEVNQRGTGFLLRILKDQGDVIRARMRRNRTLKLKVRTRVSKACSPEEPAALIAAARRRRLPCVYTALMLGLNASLRDGEILGLQRNRVDLDRLIVTVGDSKTEAGENRTIPINGDLQEALEEHRVWFEGKFWGNQTRLVRAPVRQATTNRPVQANDDTEDGMATGEEGCMRIPTMPISIPGS